MDEFNKDPFNEEKPQKDYSYNQNNIKQQGYAQPQYTNYGAQQYIPYQQTPSQGMAVASLVLGIVSIFLSAFIAILPFFMIIPIIGIILGVLHKSKKLPLGNGIAIAGIVTSIIGIVFVVIIYIFSFLLISLMPELLENLKATSPEEYEQLYDIYAKQFPEWFGEAVRFFHR